MGNETADRADSCRPENAGMDLARRQCNAILQAALYGVSIENSICYCTHVPCLLCAKAMINVGVHRVVYSEGYPDEKGTELFRDAGFEICLTCKELFR
jgi:dCMP deaminase